MNGDTGAKRVKVPNKKSPGSYYLVVTYPRPLNHYCGKSILGECFFSIMHHTSVIVCGSKRINERSVVLSKIVFST